MAPKFNPFMAYVQNFKTTLSTNEQKSISLKVLIGKLTPLWNVSNKYKYCAVCRSD